MLCVVLSIIKVWPVKTAILFEPRREKTCFMVCNPARLTLVDRLSHVVVQMSRDTAKGTSWHVRPSKTQISLHICAVWSVFDRRSMGSQGSNVSWGGKLRLIRLCRCAHWVDSSLYAHAKLCLMLDTGFNVNLLFIDEVKEIYMKWNKIIKIWSKEKHLFFYFSIPLWFSPKYTPYTYIAIWGMIDKLWDFYWIKLDFLCFSHWFSAITFFLLILSNHVRDESCREKLAPISPKGPKFVAQTDFCAHRWRFCKTLNSAKISKSFIDR